MYVVRAVVEREAGILRHLKSLHCTNTGDFRIVQIQKQRKRQLMIALRTTEPSELFEIDTERELEAIHMALYEHAETLKHWKNALEGTEIPEGQPPLPRALQDQRIKFQLNECENPEEAKMCFYSTIQDILHGTLLIEKAHRDVVNTFMS
uniref:Uncharacterized protein n=1 Tax=Parascaris equorum TaxID=6256 RepID=A0A914RHF5_PAREQ